MDAESAAETAEKIDARLADLADMREEFARVVDERRTELQEENAGGLGEAVMSEGDIDAFIGAVTQERVAKERKAEEYIKEMDENAARERGGGSLEGGSKVDEYIGEDGKYRRRLLIETSVGTMAYEYDEETGKPDMSGPRLIKADNSVGKLFMKLEKLFKDKIGDSLGVTVMSLSGRV